MISSPLAYWVSGRGLGNLTPRAKAWPEGEGFPAFLGDLLAGESVVEIGCGAGRLAACFPSGSYLGVDICREAVERARSGRVGWDFQLIGPEDPFPPGTTALLHTVLLHVPDEALPAIVARLVSYPRVVVGEILGRHWRRSGDPPVFNRKRGEYEEAFALEGFVLAGVHAIPYPHYPDTALTVMDFRQETET